MSDALHGLMEGAELFGCPLGIRQLVVLAELFHDAIEGVDPDL